MTAPPSLRDHLARYFRTLSVRQLASLRLEDWLGWLPLVLLALLALGGALRFWGLDQGLPFTMSRPDEREALEHTIAFPTGNLDPDWLVYPNPFFWLLWGWISAALALGRLVDPSLPDYATFLRERMAEAILIGRVLAALVGTGTIAIVWTLARRVSGALAAVIASTLLAVCFLHVRDSHAMKADVFLTAIVAPILWVIAAWVRRPQRTRAVAAGAAIGLGTSLKYPAILLLFSVWHGDAILRRHLGWRLLLPGLATLGIATVALAVFLVLNPFLWSDLGRFERIFTFSFWAVYGQQHSLTAAANALDTAWHWLASRSFGYHATVSLRYGFGLAMALLAPVLVARGLRTDRPVFLRLAAGFCVLYFFVIGLSQVTQSRYVTPILPLLALLAGDTVSAIAARIRPRVARAGLVLGCIVLLGAEPLASSIAHNRIAARTDTRVLAQRWMAEHLPAGAVVARLGSGFFPIADPELPPGLVAAKLPLGSTALDDHGVGWVVTHEHPLPFSRPLPAQMQRLAPRLTLLATFSPFREGPAGLFEDLDAYYIPIGQFTGVERPGPIVRIYRWNPMTRTGSPLGVDELDGDGTVRIACLGDSNTAARWGRTRNRWCELAARKSAAWSRRCGWPPLAFKNFAAGGATVISPDVSVPWAAVQGDAARVWHADLVVAAFGTNDLHVLHAEPSAIVLAYSDLVHRLSPIPVLVALAPPSRDPSGALLSSVGALNAALRIAFAADWLVDFQGNMDETLFQDAVHLNTRGQRLRALRVLARLRPLLAARWGPCRAQAPRAGTAPRSLDVAEIP